MIKTFTSNDVTRYYFGEISKDEKNEIEEAIAFDVRHEKNRKGNH